MAGGADLARPQVWLRIHHFAHPTTDLERSSCAKLDERLTVESRRPSKPSLVEERRKEDRRKLYGRQYLAMLIGVLPEDRRKGERRREAMAAPEPFAGAADDSGIADKNVAG